MKASVANTHSVHRCWQSFLRGTTRPSVSALLIVAFVFFIILSSYLFLLTADVMGGPVHRYFMDGEFDSQTIVTYRALSMKDASSPLVVILGTSVIIRCVLDEQTLASSIALHTSNKPVVYNLSADGQNTWEMAALVDCIPQGLSGVLVVGMTPSLLTFDSERLGLSITKPKLGFVSPSLDQEARRAGITPPIRTGIYSYDNAHYFLAHRRNLVFNLVSGGKD